MQNALAIVEHGGGDENPPLININLTDDEAQYIVASFSDFADPEAVNIVNRLKIALDIPVLFIV